MMRYRSWSCLALSCLLLAAGCGGGTRRTADAGSTDGAATDAGTDADAQPAGDTCDNEMHDGDESGIDCGGSCEPCEAGERCERQEDCQSGVCQRSRCLMRSCSDGVKNGPEVGVDCGGDCGLCPDGAMCASSDQCQSGHCVSSMCVPAACDDRRQNGEESDVDCGGSECSPCGQGQDCNEDGDCAAMVCTEEGTCGTATCDDGIQNQDETAIDCGGVVCSPCEDGLACEVDLDCVNERCFDGGCVSCHDELANGDETDVDCGGSCDALCEDGLMCSGDADCASDSCEGGACVSCRDGTQNQDETDVDCGGTTCPGCFGGESCNMDSDCFSNTCTMGMCEGGNALADDFEAGPPLQSFWTTSGSASWFVSTSPPIAGTYSAETGNIADSQVSNLEVTVNCASGAMVEFTYETSTESGFDYLRFFVDGTEQDSWAGTTGPTTATFPVSSGSHTLRWQYDKDGSVSSGSDTVWIDDVLVTNCTL